MADNAKDEARDAIYREITKQIEGGVGAQGLHHLAEAYALASYPSRSSSGAAAIPKS